MQTAIVATGRQSLSAMFSSYPIGSAEGWLLPLEDYIAGIVRKHYHMLAS